MPPNGEEIRARLAAFAARWLPYTGSERSGAQTFLTELLGCYGQPVDPLWFERSQQGRFLDLHWPGRCIIEMKAPAEARRLAAHRPQAKRYWEESSDAARGIEAPPYLVLCAFQRFEVWEPGRFPDAPRAEFDLAELQDRYDALQFLAGEAPVFVGGHASITTDAAQHLAALNAALADRREGGPDDRRAFLLQCVWSMFAEDLGQIPGHRFSEIVELLHADPRRSSADDLGGLFATLNDPARERPRHGLYAGVPYADGGLFERVPRLHLVSEELDLLRLAASHNWREVQPQIFGSLLESHLGHDKQWELGAHYTHDAQLQQVVQPTIVRPWRERIAALSTPNEAEAALTDLMGYVVLDPACGSGNFLYVAYRELRRIESDLLAREAQLRSEAGLPERSRLSVFFPLANVRGIETDAFAVMLARTTLWMGQRLAVEELGLDESTLPLPDLSGIVRGDALEVRWPRADAIIGNPPYHGSQSLRGILGDERVAWLSRRFGCGVQDFAVYWFRCAADEMAPGARAGFVATNSVSQGRARRASLNYVVQRGGVIVDAIARQKWPGEAVVNVSIVNWVQQPDPPPQAFVLDGGEVEGINTRLRESKVAIEEYTPLAANRGRAFQGPIPAGAFYLTPDEARALLARRDAAYADVARPYLIGDDITDDPRQSPRRWIVDFGFRPLEDAERYPAAMAIVRERVKPERDVNRDRGFREAWWRFGRPRGEMREALAPLARYIAGNAQGKRFLFAWQPAAVCPSNLTNVFAFDDDYAMGVLTSVVHQTWAHSEGSTLEERPRYTPTTCFEPFPWPQPSPQEREAIGSLAAELVAARRAINEREGIGLTALYNAIDEGAWREVADLHRRLDGAVLRAYGWPARMRDDPLELKARLAALHADIAAGRVAYAPFA